jgi:phosphatidylglycerophosphatase C
VKRNLALFDFDGTITRKDTFLEVIKFAKGTTRFYIGTLWLTPVLFLYKFKLIPNWRAKELFFGHFFKGDSVEDFQDSCSRFAAHKLPALIRPSALGKLKEHLNASDRIIIVTASASDWIKPWSDQFGIEIVSTQWAEHNSRLTGKIKGRNCYGPVKKEMILALINPADYKTISVYGDTEGDREMLTLGTPFFKYFND